MIKFHLSGETRFGELQLLVKVINVQDKQGRKALKVSNGTNKSFESYKKIYNNYKIYIH